ncbi:MAG: exopolyphosphatase [Bradymonadia bacterium]
MSDQYAAIDLGSNSFHMLVVRVVDDEIHVVDKIRKRVRLAAGLTAARMLEPHVRQRALKCLRNFGQRLVDIPVENVRACATNTFRKLADGEAFTRAAETALGYPIDIISGQEEARLVYRGVCENLESDTRRRLVVDIGGGSTECIIGHGADIIRADSLYMGCVEFSRKFFPDGHITHERIEHAVIAARLELGSLHRPFKAIGWEVAVGSSGTINAIQDLLSQRGAHSDDITLAGLRWLLDRAVEIGHADELVSLGLKPERAAVITGGLCILYGLFRSLSIEKMRASSSALREGVIADLLGRVRDQDVRDETVRRLQQRYAVDQRQAERVRNLVHALAGQAFPHWEMESEDNRKLLEWAALLHEIGKTVNYTGYHRHGAYLVAHTNMAGFSRTEQTQLAALILGQRRKLVVERIQDLVGHQIEPTLRLIVLFRLATRLLRTRSPRPRPHIGLRVDGNRIKLKFPLDWIKEKPLTRADLKQEAQWLSEAGFKLTWNSA